MAVAELNVFVLCSERPSGTPDHVVTNSDPARLLESLRAANRGGDVHLIGGPRTIETFRALGALDQLVLVVLPMPFGAGMQLTPSLSPGTGLILEQERVLSGGSVEIVYACLGRRDPIPGRPASQGRTEPSRDHCSRPSALVLSRPR
jgi:dihydrofolate reductase